MKNRQPRLLNKMLVYTGIINTAVEAVFYLRKSECYLTLIDIRREVIKNAQY